LTGLPSVSLPLALAITEITAAKTFSSHIEAYSEAICLMCADMFQYSEQRQGFLPNCRNCISFAFMDGVLPGNSRYLLILLAHPYCCKPCFSPRNSGFNSSKPFSNPAAFAVSARLLGFT